MHTIHRCFNPIYFPWLLDTNNEPVLEHTCNSKEEAIKWVENNGNSAFTYLIEEQK